MDSQDVNPNDQPQPSKEDDISYGSIHNSMETGTISPTEILKPSALLKEESVWDSFRASSQPINHPRRTSVGDLQFRNDSEQLSPHHSQRRSSCQIGSGSMPFLFRSQSPPPSQSHPSPFLRHGSATFSSHDLTLTQQQQQHHHHYQPQAHLNHHINRPHYQLQHSHSLPATPSPLPFSWPGSSHDSGFPTLAPPPSHYVEDRMEGTFADSSAEVDHKTPPSNPFDHSEPEQPSCTSPSFSTIATPGPYTPSLSLTHYHFDLRPMNFLNDSPDKNGTENQDRSTSNQSTPIPAMFHLIRPSSQPINNPFPTRPLSANAATHHKLSSTSLQIDPSLIPDHLSTEHRFGLSKSAYDGSRRASMVEESLFSSILHREFVDTPLNSHNSGLAMPLPPMSALQSRRPSSIAGSLTEDPNTSLDSLSTAPTTANQPSGTYLPVPHSTTQRSSSLPPPVIPDSMRYLLLPSPSGSANLSPLTSTYIHGDTTSLFDEAFSAFVEPLHSSQCDSSNDLQMNFDTEIHDKDGQTSGLRGVDQSHSRGNGEPLVCLDPTPKMSLPPFSALASSSLMTESQDELITPQHNPRTRTAMEESFGSQLRRSFPDLNYVDTLKPDESGDSSLESLHDAERRGSLEAIPSPRAINGLAKSGASFKCTSEGCTKAFGRRSDLARHTRIHTGERPYPCEHTGCGKRFIQRSALTVHMRTHSGEKPHSCVFPGCDKAFADSSSLARHRRTHNKNKLYLCKVGDCEKNFTRRTALAKHLKSHDNVIGSGIG